MRVLVFGQTGQVARELDRVLPDATFLGRDQADLTRPEACAQIICDCDADAVINAAAYTAVDQAETDEATAQLVNGDTPGAMARAAAARDLPFVHISTDYVFDGRGDAPYRPADPTGPVGAYGRTKLAGEEAVRAAGGRFAILRTSWVVSAHGHNFVKTMLRLGAERDGLNVVADQVGGPTCAADIARAVVRMAQGLAGDAGHSGTYHFAGSPNVSWADFARHVFARAGLNCRITDIPTSAYPTPAARPENSRLDMTDTTARFGIERPDWRLGLDDILGELGVLND
jgi:dTDP-4-dehydrorhamnose reductase